MRVRGADPGHGLLVCRPVQPQGLVSSDPRGQDVAFPQFGRDGQGPEGFKGEQETLESPQFVEQSLVADQV